MNVVCHENRFVPKLFADKLLENLEVLPDSTDDPPRHVKTLVDCMVDVLNKKYDVSYTSIKIRQSVPKGLSHHLVLSRHKRQLHGRLVVIYASQAMDDLGQDGLVVTFV